MKLLNGIARFWAVFSMSLIITGLAFAGRDGSGVYTAPSNSFNPAVTGATIDPTDWNAILDDLESALTDSMTGPASSTDDGIVIFDGTNGRAVKDSGLTASGADTSFVTGTAGTSGDLVTWNGDGDIVDGPTPPVGTIVGTSDTQTLTNKTFDAANNTLSLTADSVDAITEIASAIKSGADGTIITGTAGTDGNLAQWNSDGDIVDGPDVLDEDDFSSNSASAVPTQQSTKAYIDGSVIGQQAIYIPAKALTSRTTSGCEALSSETTTNDIMLDTCNFDDTTDEFAQFSLQMPKSWNGGTLIFQFVWEASDVSGDKSVIWGAQAVCIANNGASDAALGTAQTVTDANGGTANDVMISDETSAVTPAGSPAGEQWCVLQVYRDANAAGDNLTGDAFLMGVKVHYTTTAATED